MARRKTAATAANPIPYVVFGVLFGYFLSKSRATDYDSIINMFRLREFQLYGVILVAVAVVAWGLYWMGKSAKYSGKPVYRDPHFWIILALFIAAFFLNRTPDYSKVHKYLLPVVAVLETGWVLFWVCWRVSSPVFRGAKDWETLKWDPDRLIGALLFGSGWALAGTCPGTSLAQIGEGKLVAFFTVIGIAVGVWSYRKIKPGNPAKDQVC